MEIVKLSEKSESLSLKSCMSVTTQIIYLY